MEAVTIRELREADLGAVAAINAEHIPAVGEADEAKLRAIWEWSSVALVAVGGDDVPVGFCLVLGPGTPYGSQNYRWFAERYDDFAYLDRVAITSDATGRGIGAALYREVERRASAPWFVLEVNLRPRNDGSLRFHERAGFVEVGQQETDYGALVSMLAKPFDDPS